MKLFDLTGRVAVVTGGNGGIGLGYAEGLVAAGCTVSIWGRNEQKNAAAVARLAKLGAGKVESRVCDTSDRSATDAAMADVLKTFGRVDGMFANAGIGGGRKAFIDRTDEEWDQMLATNLHGVRYSLQAAARHMIDRAKNGDPFGRLVVTSSLSAISGTAQNEHYAVSKTAGVALVRALAVEMARFGITANAILPGWTRSELMGPNLANDKFVANVLARVPVRRWGEPEDFSAIAVYLMSNGSSFHTGDSILIDGGYAMY